MCQAATFPRWLPGYLRGREYRHCGHKQNVEVSENQFDLPGQVSYGDTRRQRSRRSSILKIVNDAADHGTYVNWSGRLDVSPCNFGTLV